MLKKTTSALLFALTALTVGTAANADVITLTHTGADDIFLRETQAGTNQGDTRNLFGGQGTDQGFVTLMHFGLADLVTATGGAAITINSVTLDLGPAMTSGAGLGVTEYDGNLNAYTAFDAATATWSDPDGSAGADATAGGTIGTLLSTGTFTIADTSPTTRTFSSTAALVSFLQSAYDGTTDVDFRLGAADDSVNAFLRTDAGAVTGTGQATLVVDYTVVPEPGSLALLGLGGLMLVRRRRN